MTTPRIAFKVDVDTFRGTQDGVPRLVELFQRYAVPATFYFSLGPDNTGKCIRRVLRPGFLKKVQRTSVVQLYGIKTLLYGTLLPAPDIGRELASTLQLVMKSGFEVGINAYDHFEWQDYVQTWPAPIVEAAFMKAQQVFKGIFGVGAHTAAAPGWQANHHSLQAYDNAELLYGSDCRGSEPFFPSIDGHCFRTLQIPTTLPTLDELLGQPHMPESAINLHYLQLISQQAVSVHTIHAEIEGMKKFELFEDLLKRCKAQGFGWLGLEAYAKSLLRHPEPIPFCEVVQLPVEGRSGLLACQGETC